MIAFLLGTGIFLTWRLRGLQFRKLKLVLPGGRIVEDNEPDTDDLEAAAASFGDASRGGGISTATSPSRISLSRTILSNPTIC